MEVLKAQNISKSFGTPAHQVLFDVSFSIKKPEFLSITGRSGSVKSTLLYIISSLDQPSTGKLFLAGKDISQMSEEQLHNFRNQEMGFIFQFHYLLPELSAMENVLMPARKTNQHVAKQSKAMELLEAFGLIGKENRPASQL